MRKQFLRTCFAVLLLLLVLPSVRADAAKLKAEKELGDGYTLTCYRNTKTRKIEYAVMDLVIRDKVGGTVIASQLKNRYRPGWKQRFFLDGREKASRKSGKAVRLYSLKKGTKIRVTFDYKAFMDSISLEVAHVIPDPADPTRILYTGEEIPGIHRIDLR